jgi:hypothetical protein
MSEQQVCQTGAPSFALHRVPPPTVVDTEGTPNRLKVDTHSVLLVPALALLVLPARAKLL